MLEENTWWAAFLAFNVAVACWDLRARRVPNRLLVAGAAAQALWLLVLAWQGLSAPVGAPGLGEAFGAFLLGLLFVVFWKWRVMGAGDVKCLAVLGLLLGFWPWLMVVVLAGIPSGLHAAAQAFSVLRHPRKPRRGVPYAAYLALAAASLAFMPSSSPWCSWCSSWLPTRF